MIDITPKGNIYGIVLTKKTKDDEKQSVKKSLLFDFQGLCSKYRLIAQKVRAHA